MYKLSKKPVFPPAQVYVTLKADEFDTASTMSYLGTPVYSNLVIQAGSYIDENGDTVNYDELILNTVLMDVNQTKNIITTAIQGRPGTIKEYISDGDFDINIKGVIQSQAPNKFPEEEVKKLIQILKVSDSLKITSTYLNRLGIFDIVIKTYALNQAEGYYGLQPFTIQAVSDIPLQLLTNNA